MGAGEFYRELIKKLETEEAVGVFTDTACGGRKSFAGEQPAGKDGVMEWYSGHPRAVICGGGHISLALCHLFHMLDFKITLIDDRFTFASKERFTEAEEVICQPFEEVFRTRKFGKNTYFIIVTRGHEFDTLCLRQILKQPGKYIGMIGSRTKVRIAFEQLMEEGVSQEQLSQVHAPIGLDIGARTPEEIAISIAAEAVQIMRKGSRELIYLEDAVAEQIRSGKKGILLSVIEKKGSSPGKEGSHIFLDEAGNQYGTIGGGTLEYEAVQTAKLKTSEETEIYTYDLSNGPAAKLGMACGGQIRVLFEMIEETGL